MQVPINPYGKAKKMAEDIILDFSKKSDMAVMILRYFNVIGSDPEGRLGEAPRPELREHGRISGRSVKEFVKACKKATGVEVKVEYLSRRPGDYAEVYSDPSKINEELNWTAQYINLQESLSIAWRWQKAHPNGYGS
ncbi:hypothetical protein BHE74_00049900 [Ensete ventricosum]|uniref:NAD-dependent epimerase/dehydratase domain-containing protein n=1 Tax=Ensete ventricosum TaxID=4639 RepID=A0A445M8N0_ENSVE|nr:hypothetical protein BHE74_00049900 [Ensete ventricosum]RZR70554.1 hypothetical protein BHM03_00000431 [Ensete ventricosum]